MTLRKRQMQRIDSEEQLEALLVSEGIDLSEWGVGKAKTTRDLWNEITEGVSVIETGPICRTVPVVQVLIRKDGYILIEAEQRLKDGRLRRRNILPSEKIRPGEDLEAAAIRCLLEEVGVDRQDVEIIEAPSRQVDEETESPSYPGLNTKYSFKIVETRVRGLPDSDFWTLESSDNEDDPVHSHHWTWRPE